MEKWKVIHNGVYLNYEISSNQYPYSESFYEFYETHLEPLFSIRISKYKFEKEEDFIEHTVKCLSLGIPVLVGIDKYKLYYDSEYMKNHGDHFIPLKGYDLERKLFYCLDTSHNHNSTCPIYIDDVITFNMLWDIYDSKTYLTFETTNSREMKKFNEIAISFYMLLKSLYGDRKTKIDGNILLNTDFLQMQNTRVVYYTELINFMKKISITPKRFEELCDLVNQVLRCWEKLKMFSLYNEKSLNSDRVNHYLENFYEKENMFHTIFLKNWTSLFCLM